MWFFLFLMLVLGLLWLLIPYALTRLVLMGTLASYKDKTSPEAARGVRTAAAICAGTGLLLGLELYNYLGVAWVVAIGLVPHWVAIAIPLRVKAPAQAAAPEAILDSPGSRVKEVA